MILDKLYLTSFRNYKNCSLNFNPKFNFIWGDNGNGKTNILEAISLICYTKSFLQSPEQDCVSRGSSEFQITGEFINGNRFKSKVLFNYNKDIPDKQIYCNEEPVGKFSSFFGKIPLVILSPQDIKLTSGLPYDKRRNFDILISQTSRIYYDDLRNLNRIITQKNSLLKENLLHKKYSADELKALLEPWNNALIEYGVKILLKRIAFIKEFQGYLKDNFKDIVGDLNIPELNYISSVTDELNDDELNEINISNKFREKINQHYQAELRRGVSIIGPHRDNYIFRIMKNGEDFELRHFGSQGEQKTFLVALKLSEYQYLRDKLDNTGAGEPILLLDDLFSELDKYRVGRISNVLPEFKQVFLTTTNVDYLELIKNNFKTEDISIVNVANGTAALRN